MSRRLPRPSRKSHPGRYVGVFAYWNVEQPPRNRTRLPDNVLVALTLDILQHYDPAYRDKDRALIRGWNGYTKNLHTYVYYGLGWYTPRMSPRLVAEDLRFSARNGVQAIYCESYPFWAWCGPMHYVAARLQWDVNADVDRILDEFYRDCFGDMAGPCGRFTTRASDTGRGHGRASGSRDLIVSRPRRPWRTWRSCARRAATWRRRWQGRGTNSCAAASPG